MPTQQKRRKKKKQKSRMTWKLLLRIQLNAAQTNSQQCQLPDNKGLHFPYIPLKVCISFYIIHEAVIFKLEWNLHAFDESTIRTRTKESARQNSLRSAKLSTCAALSPLRKPSKLNKYCDLIRKEKCVMSRNESFRRDQTVGSFEESNHIQYSPCIVFAVQVII